MPILCKISEVNVKQTTDGAKNAVQRYAATHFPEALAVLLSGSWARGEAHDGSDLDIIVIDESVERVLFEGAVYENWIIDVCVLNPIHAKTFFEDSAGYRSAPIAHQMSDSILIVGDASLAEQIRVMAIDALAQGPDPISESDRLEMRFYLTLLREDLAHASAETLPALAAYSHVQLSKAVLDLARHWRAERKALRRALVEVDHIFAKRLDDALVDAIQGNPSLMIVACSEVISSLGGSQRTYDRFTA